MSAKFHGEAKTAAVKNEGSSSRQQSKEELVSVFNKFDANGDGKISVADLGSLMRSLGHDAPEEDLRKMIKDVDSDGDGFISLQEFVEVNAVKSSVEELKEAFGMFDLDKSGVISAAELHKVLKKLGEETSMEECVRMIRAVDTDGDGAVNFEEFRAMMTNKSSSTEKK